MVLKVRRLSSRTKMTVFLCGTLVLALIANVSWMAYDKKVKDEKELVEHCRVLSVQMNAVWEYMEVNQGKIDSNPDGTYSFKGVYCSVAGKAIAKFIERDSDYALRYVDLTPRALNSTPDAYETSVLNRFEAGTCDEWYSYESQDGERVFRYMAPVYLDQSCLSCHGSPEGEIDITGYPKEGLSVGDLGGAISITVPAEESVAAARREIITQCLYFLGLSLIAGLLIFWAMTKLYSRPLREFETAVAQMESGNFDVHFDGLDAESEMGLLARKFESMAVELRGLYESLDEQVEDRTSRLAEANSMLERQQEQLQHAYASLKKESEHKSDFLAIMSHELRTPLSSIIAFTELWEKTAAADADDRQRMLVSEIKASSQSLLYMVNNTLAAARLEFGKAECVLAEADAVDLLGSVHDELAVLAEKKGVRLSVEVSPDVPILLVDRDKMRSVMENLGSNAIKFTPSGGSVRMSAALDSSGGVVFRVSDTGCGIREDDCEAIFDQFVQTKDGENCKVSGSGLGLFIAKRYTEMHGGSISVESEYGKGSVFEVSLPPSCMEVGYEDYDC